MPYNCATRESANKSHNKGEDKGLVFFNLVKQSKNFNCSHAINKTK